MADYLAGRIIDGAFTYDYVISKKPLLKTEIDIYLILQEKENLITI